MVAMLGFGSIVSDSIAIGCIAGETWTSYLVGYVKHILPPYIDTASTETAASKYCDDNDNITTLR